eukprot:SAG31_NODE_4289_length_3376_cov_1044.267928_2_plen_197_part_00
MSFGHGSCTDTAIATHTQQIWYWSISVAICTVSLVALYIFLLRNWCKKGLGRMMTGPAFMTFYPMMVGDFMFLLTYFPSHLFNVVSEVFWNPSGNQTRELDGDDSDPDSTSARKVTHADPHRTSQAQKQRTNNFDLCPYCHVPLVQVFCYVQTIGAVTSVHMQFAGILLLAYSPYKTMIDTLNNRLSYGAKFSFFY